MKKERTLDKTSRVFMALTTAALFVVTLFCTTGAIAQDKATPAAEKPTVYREKAGTITATIQAIDLEKRIVKVKGGPRGEMVEFKADERVKNLSRLKVGDEVVVEYFASVAVWVKKPGDVKETMEKAQVEGPGSEVRQITVTATIQDIDKDRNNVFLRWPEGVIVGMQVKDPSILEGVKVGDQVVITYTEALAISIEKEKP